MSRLIRAVVAVFAVSCLVAGCQPTSPVPSPTASGTGSNTSGVPTPTFLCTPEAGGDESPCTQAQYDEMKAKDALYEEAEDVFREYFAENVRISRAGGVTEPTEVILATTAESVREDVMAVFADMAKRGVRARGEDPSLTITRAPGLSTEGSLVALTVCADASRWSFYRGDELVSQGRPAQERVYFKRFDEDLKMAFSEGKWVEKCT